MSPTQYPDFTEFPCTPGGKKSACILFCFILFCLLFCVIGQTSCRHQSNGWNKQEAKLFGKCKFKFLFDLCDTKWIKSDTILNCLYLIRFLNFYFHTFPDDYNVVCFMWTCNKWYLKAQERWYTAAFFCVLYDYWWQPVSHLRYPSGIYHPHRLLRNYFYCLIDFS